MNGTGFYENAGIDPVVLILGFLVIGALGGVALLIGGAVLLFGRKPKKTEAPAPVPEPEAPAPEPTVPELPIPVTPAEPPAPVHPTPAESIPTPEAPAPAPRTAACPICGKTVSWTVELEDECRKKGTRIVHGNDEGVVWTPEAPAAPESPNPLL